MPDEFRVPTTLFEKTTPTFRCQLKNGDGSVLNASQIASLSMTLENQSGSIVNGRNHINVLNANGGQIDSSGRFAWTAAQGDMTIQDPAVETDEHLATFELVKADANATYIAWQVVYVLKRLNKSAP